MSDSELAESLLRDQFTASAALIAPMLKNLPDEVRARVMEAVGSGTGKVELRTRVESTIRSWCLYRRMGRSRSG